MTAPTTRTQPAHNPHSGNPGRYNVITSRLNQHAATLWADIARDDRHTTRWLHLLRNGHPGSPTPDNGPTYPDPTGEWAILPDTAANLETQYKHAINTIIRQLHVADNIRRRMQPPATITETKDATG